MQSRGLVYSICLSLLLSLAILQSWRKLLGPLSLSSATGLVQQRDINVLLSSWDIDKDDLTAALATALSSSERIQVTFCSNQTGQEAEDGFASLIKGLPWRHNPDFIPAAATPLRISSLGIDIMIASNCIEDLLIRPVMYRALFSSTSAYLYCAVFNATLLQTDGPAFDELQPWIRAQRLRILASSEHIIQYLRNDLAHLALLTPMTMIAPVFRIPSKKLGRHDDDLVTQVYERIGIIAHDHTSANAFAGASEAMQHMPSLSNFSVALSEAVDKKWRQADGILLGSLTQLGESSVLPEHFERSGEEEDGPLSLYRSLAQTSALLVSIPSAERGQWLAQETTSALMAAVIAGTPVVVDGEILQQYTHLSTDAVILTRPGENHMQAAFRQLSYPSLSQTRKRRNVVSLRTTLIVQNKYKLRQALCQDTQTRC